MSFPSPTATSVSSVPAVKKALFDAFTADAALGAATPAVGVFWASPNYDHAHHEFLHFVASTADVQFATMGRGPLNRDENASLTIRVQVFREGTDAYACEQRWWAIQQAVEKVLLVQPSPAGDSWARLGTVEQQTDTYSDGILAAGTLTIAVFNRLR